MSKDNLCIQEFLPSQVLERHTGLDQKRRKYLELMNDKTAPWANVHGLDQRHDDFEDFRFLYYKFFISCQVLLISKNGKVCTRAEHHKQMDIRSIYVTSSLN